MMNSCAAPPSQPPRSFFLVHIMTVSWVCSQVVFPYVCEWKVPKTKVPYATFIFVNNNNPRTVQLVIVRLRQPKVPYATFIINPRTVQSVIVRLMEELFYSWACKNNEIMNYHPKFFTTNAPVPIFSSWIHHVLIPREFHQTLVDLTSWFDLLTKIASTNLTHCFFC